nr:hypothetical protein [uncultured Selenomonas sp.]
MSNWTEYQFTRQGAELRAKVEAGQCKLKLTKMKIGEGNVKASELETMTDLKSPQLIVGISSCTVSEEDSKVCKVVGIATSGNVENSFLVTELGLYATDPEVGEILYLVCLDSAPERMPNKQAASPVTLTYQFDVVTSNTANVTAVITPTGLATAKMIEDHRKAEEIDHPDASVTTPKIRDGAVTSVKIAERAIEKKHLRKGGIVAGDIGAYSKEDVDKLLDDHRTKTPLDHPDGSVLKRHLGFEVYDKSEVYSKNETNQSYRKIGNRIVGGDVDWNTLTEPATYKIQGVVMDAAHHAPSNEYNFGLLVVNRLENGADGGWRTVQTYFPHSTRGYWSRMYNGPADYRAENWLEWRYIPTHNEVETIAEQKANAKVSKSGDTMTGPLNFAENQSMRTCIFPSHYFHNLFENGNTVFMHAFPSHPSPAKTTQFEFRTASGEQGKWTSHVLDSSGFTTPTIRFSKWGYIGDGRRDTGEAIEGNGGANLNIGSWWGIGFYDQCNKRYTGNMDLRSGSWRTLGPMTANTFYANDWFRAKGDTGFYFQDHGSGWHMTDNDWIRAWGGKGIYTSGKMRCDAGFEGNLRGTADNATRATNADKLQGKDVNHFYRRLGGRETPTLVPLVDWERMKKENGGQDVRNIRNPATGIVAYGGGTTFGGKYANGTIFLKQSYRNFDKVLVFIVDVTGRDTTLNLLDSWLLFFLFANSFTLDLVQDATLIWNVYGNKRGSSSEALSTETLWRGFYQNCGLIEIYGMNY